MNDDEVFKITTSIFIGFSILVLHVQFNLVFSSISTCMFVGNKYQLSLFLPIIFTRVSYFFTFLQLCSLSIVVRRHLGVARTKIQCFPCRSLIPGSIFRVPTRFKFSANTINYTDSITHSSTIICFLFHCFSPCRSSFTCLLGMEKA